MPKRFATIDLLTGLPETAVVARNVAVVDATARLALTTATVRNGDFVREIGRSEVTKLTCLGSTYTPAVAEVVDLTIPADVGGSLQETGCYAWRPSDATYVIFWFNVDGTGINPENFGPEDVGIHYRAVAISTGDTAAAVATALKTAMDLELLTDMTVVRTVAVIRLSWLVAGVLDDTASDADTSGVVPSEVSAGAAATHTLEGDTLTLYSGANVARTVGFSLAGNVGAIAITLPASTRTAAQIAALAQAQIDLHADFSAVQGTGGAAAEVTVTTAAIGWPVTDASAGSTGFTIAVLQQSLAPYGTFVLVDETVIGTDAAWRLAAPRLLAYANPSNAVSMADGVLTPVTWSAQLVDFGCLNLGTGVFTAPRAMTVLVTAAVHFDFSGTTTAKCFMNLLKNGTAIVRLAEINARKVTGSVTLNLAAGDTLAISAHQLSGGTVTLNATGLGSLFQITEL